jgi:bifunctional non-homologous end joining protein LigD
MVEVSRAEPARPARPERSRPPAGSTEQGADDSPNGGTGRTSGDKLRTYRRKRDPKRTPEPIPTGPLPAGNDDTFVIQEHHARRLHWDVRLERHGVLVSWAVPKGLPPDPRTNHLAVHTEDHPLEYATFQGDIPRGEYGGGTVLIWDRGRYELEKWSEREVKVVLHGSRVEGRYVFFQTRGADWMVHRMDPPLDPNWVPVPDDVRPMRPVAGDLPRPSHGEDWAYEMLWSGERAFVRVEGGRAQVIAADGRDVTATYPELRAIGPALGIRSCLFDGEIVALDSSGRPNSARLRQRAGAAGATAVRRAAADAPVTYFGYDLLHLDGGDTTALPYSERRVLLESVGMRGPHWEVPPAIPDDGAEAVAASRSFGLGGVVAKRTDSPYQPGHRSPFWRIVSNRPTQRVVVGGWIGTSDDADELRAVLVGESVDDGVQYAGTVRTGLTAAARAELLPLLRRIARHTSPFAAGAPDGADIEWVRPTLVGEVSFGGRTADGRLRRPAWRRLL